MIAPAVANLGQPSGNIDSMNLTRLWKGRNALEAIPTSPNIRTTRAERVTFHDVLLGLFISSEPSLVM